MPFSGHFHVPIVSKKFNVTEGTNYWFWCPGCECAHRYAVPRWSFNGNEQSPTFTPSLLCSSEKFCCHLFMTDGKLKFLGDCTHKLAGQTVDVPELPEWLQ